MGQVFRCVLSPSFSAGTAREQLGPDSPLSDSVPIFIIVRSTRPLSLCSLELTDGCSRRLCVRRSRRRSSSLSCSDLSNRSSTTRPPTQRRMPSSASMKPRRRRS